MLRTSLRKTAGGVQEQAFAFLSSNAQDFIEETIIWKQIKIIVAIPEQ